MVVSLWKYRRLIVHNSINDLRNRYSGSLAGYVWNILIPLAQITVFSIVFGWLMGRTLPADSPLAGHRFGFVIFLCAGLVPWNAFADTLSRGVSSLAGNAGYLKKLAVPEQIFVAQDACSGLLSVLLAMALFLLFAVAVGHQPHWAWVQIVPGLLLLLAFAFGLGLLLSCINVFFRDVQPFVAVVLPLWFWLTPIVYFAADETYAHNPWVRSLFHANPAYYFIRGFQQAVYENEWIAWPLWAICAGIALAANVAAYLVLRKLRAEIRDVL